MFCKSVKKCAARCIGGTRRAGGGSPSVRTEGGTRPRPGGASPSSRTGVRRGTATLRFKMCVSTARGAEHASVSLQKAGWPRSGAHVLGLGGGAANGGEG